MAKKPTKSQVYDDLISQLSKMGAQTATFQDQIEDYMKFWSIKDGLQKDIKKRGVVYKDFSAVGVEMMKNNPSTKELVMVNKQMLSILKELGLSTSNCAADDDEL